MIQSRVVTPLAKAAPVADLLDWPAVRGLRGVQLQAPTANSAAIIYGGRGAQLFELAAGGTTDVLPIVHLNDLYVSGNGINTLRVLAIS